MSAYSTRIISLSPLVYLRLGEASGTNAADASGNSRNGTYTSSPTQGVAGAVVGDPDTAVTFNGTNQCVTVPATGLPSTDVDQSVECWVKFTTTTTGLYIAGRDSGSGTSGGMAIRTLTGGKLQLGNPGTGYAQSSSAFNDGNWHHVVGIRHQAAGTFELYVDGLSVATATFGNTTGATTLNVARRGNNTSFFPGTIDEVAYYNFALSADQIGTDYQLGARGGPIAINSTPVLRASNF